MDLESKRKSEDILEYSESESNCTICAKRKPNKKNKSEIWKDFINLETNQWKKLLNLQYGTKVAFIYNPLDYAKELHEDYVKKYCQGEKELLLLGMNPGPWGMCQTGVPFGEVQHVKNWLNINGEVKFPNKVHRLRPIEGLNCKRVEVSGDRMWDLLKELSGEPEVLFRHVFLHNYCPLAFLSDSGKNITPPDLKVKERRDLEDICDVSLIEVVKLLNVKHLVCIGKYVLDRAQKALSAAGLTSVQVILLMHPSPVNPKANKGWKDIASKQLGEANLLNYFKCS